MSSAIRFNPAGSNFCHLVRSASVPDYNADYTVMWQFYMTNDTVANAVAFYIHSAGETYYDYWGVDSARKCRLKRQGGAANDTQIGSTVLAVGTFYHLAVVGTTTNIKLYLNGVLEVTVSVATAARGAATTMYSAARSIGTDQIDGRLSAGRAWQSALTPAEIVTEMASATAVKASAWADWQTPAGSTRGDDFSVNGRHWTSNGSLTDEAGPTYGGAAPPASSVVVTVTATDPQGRTGTRNLTLSL